MVYLTGLAVHRASAGYRGQGKTDAKDAQTSYVPRPWLTATRRPGNYLAFLGLAAALCCYKRLLKLTM
jgi:hypothetical protein